MRRITVRPAAEADLFDIADYIALDSPVRAMAFVDGIVTLWDGLAEFPERYPARPDLGEGIRQAAYGRYLLFYTVSRDEVTVLRVLHGGRDLPTIQF